MGSMRFLLTTAAVVVFSLRSMGQGASARDLLVNGGFEQGTQGWTAVLGPYGRPGAGWEQGRGIAETVQADAYEGEHGLRLNAGDLDHEIDAYSARYAVHPGTAYILEARVRHVRGPGRYKVVIDWHDADGQHLAYDNDWRGNGTPALYAPHGGLFFAPEEAVRANVILGVASGNEFLFDAVSLTEVPTSASDLRQVPDGVGRAAYIGPERVAAGSTGTFRILYTAGAEGLPIGTTVTFRRSTPDPRWSLVQTVDPVGLGYTVVRASNGARLWVHPGAELAVPSVTRVTVMGPALDSGDTIEIVYGDRSKGGPGARVQPVAAEDVLFWVGVDGDRDGRTLDVPGLDSFDIVPGEVREVAVLVPHTVETGSAFRVSVRLLDSGGNEVEDYRGVLRLRTGAGETLTHDFDGRGPGRHEFPCTAGAPGVQSLVATVRALRCERTVRVGRALPDLATLPPGRQRADESLVLRNEFVTLCLPREREGFTHGVLFVRDGERLRRLGVVPHFGELRTAHGNVGLVATDVDEIEDGFRLSGTTDIGRGRWRFDTRFRLRPGDRHVGVATRVTPEVTSSLLAFYGPTFLAGDGSFGRRKNTALLPGLEYLEGEESSSAPVGVIPPYHERWTPHPYKITVPLMAVAAEGLCAAVFWDPLQRYDGEHACPSVRFASPNRRPRPGAPPGATGDNHLLALFAPSVLAGLPENAATLAEPVSVAAGRGLTLTADIVGLSGAEDVTAAVEYWHSLHGLPPFPPRLRTWAEEKDLLIRGYVETAWDEEAGGWLSTIVNRHPAGYRADYAASMWHFLQSRPGTPLRSRIEDQLRGASPGGRPSGFEMAYFLGDPVEALHVREAQSRGAAASQAVDGSWGYRPHTGRPPSVFTQGHARAIGRGGEVCCGTCLNLLSGIWATARMTGEPSCIQAGLKGLRFLESQGYRRPQGSENWEVPLECPNLRAAALAVEAYLDAFLVTGEARFLERSRYWAMTGLPFIYLWRAPDREIMPYASISVMGTTFWTLQWFGTPVQWVGLVYARAIQRLSRFDQSVDWRRLAEGILLSAMQQEMDQVEEPRSRLGFLTDNINIITRDICQWYISPTHVDRALGVVTGGGPWIRAEVVRSATGTVHITSPAEIDSAVLGEDVLRFSLTGQRGLAYRTVVAGLTAPGGVRADDVAIAMTSGPELSPGQFRYDEQTGFLTIAARQTGERLEVSVSGAKVQRREGVAAGDSLMNGGFERGRFGWVGAPDRAVTTVRDCHGGSKSVLLDAREVEPEVQCTSSPFRVEAGKRYRLTSYVKSLAGGGGFKVTVHWLGPSHIRYDNDWRGSGGPRDWTVHGGVFTAAEGATTASIILGCRSGSAYLFDDVALEEVGE